MYSVSGPRTLVPSAGLLDATSKDGKGPVSPWTLSTYSPEVVRAVRSEDRTSM